MLSIIDVILRLILYLGIIGGIWLFAGRFFIDFIRQKRRGYRFSGSQNERPESRFSAHIRLLIMLATSRKGKDDVFYFMFFSVFLFMSTFAFFVILFGISIFFVLLSIFIGLLPYIYLRFRLKRIQLEGSYEAENLIAELTNMYKISDYNMISAIDKTIENIKGSPLSKKALFILSLKIKDYKDRQELESAVDFFVSMFGTEWATLLGMNIFESTANGTNVSVSLDEILASLKQIKDSIEKDKRANYEAFTMVKFVIPVVYVLSVFTCVKYFGFTISKFFYYQFYSALGLKFFIAIVVLSIISFWSMYILSKPKFDF